MGIMNHGLHKVMNPMNIPISKFTTTTHTRGESKDTSDNYSRSSDSFLFDSVEKNSTIKLTSFNSASRLN